MRKTIYLLSCIILFWCPKHASAQSAEDFNTHVTNSADSLYLFAATWLHAYQNARVGDKGYGELSSPRKDLQKYIDHQLKIFKNPETEEGAEKVRLALFSLYQFEKTFVENEFAAFENLNANATDGEVNACKDKLIEKSKNEKVLLAALNKERKDYVTANGIEIAPPPDAPKPIYRRPGTPRKQSATPPPPPQPTRPTTAQAPPPQTPQPRKAAPAPTPMSKGNPNAKMPPPGEDEDGEKPATKQKKDKEDSDDEDDEKEK